MLWKNLENLKMVLCQCVFLSDVSEWSFGKLPCTLFYPVWSSGPSTEVRTVFFTMSRRIFVLLDIGIVVQWEHLNHFDLLLTC